jgi:hypothetical protein
VADQAAVARPAAARAAAVMANPAAAVALADMAAALLAPAGSRRRAAEHPLRCVVDSRCLETFRFANSAQQIRRRTFPSRAEPFPFNGKASGASLGRAVQSAISPQSGHLKDTRISSLVSRKRTERCTGPRSSTHCANRPRYRTRSQALRGTSPFQFRLTSSRRHGAHAN